MIVSANPSPGRAHDPSWGISAEEPDNRRAITDTAEVPTKRDNDAALTLGARPIQQHKPAALTYFVCHFITVLSSWPFCHCNPVVCELKVMLSVLVNVWRSLYSPTRKFKSCSAQFSHNFDIFLNS